MINPLWCRAEAPAAVVFLLQRWILLLSGSETAKSPLNFQDLSRDVVDRADTNQISSSSGHKGIKVKVTSPRNAIDQGRFACWHLCGEVWWRENIQWPGRGNRACVVRGGPSYIVGEVSQRRKSAPLPPDLLRPDAQDEARRWPAPVRNISS